MVSGVTHGYTSHVERRTTESPNHLGFRWLDPNPNETARLPSLTARAFWGVTLRFPVNSRTFDGPSKIQDKAPEKFSYQVSSKFP